MASFLTKVDRITTILNQTGIPLILTPSSSVLTYLLDIFLN